MPLMHGHSLKHSWCHSICEGVWLLMRELIYNTVTFRRQGPLPRAVMTPTSHHLQAGGRSSCGNYVTAAVGCSSAITLATKLADATAQRRQQWLFTRQGDGSYIVSSVACGGKVLALPASCSATQAQLLASGSGAYKFTLAAAKAPIPPSPSPSPR